MMDYFSHLKWIQEMLDRADPGREMREQQESIRKMLDRADPGREMREQQESIRKMLDRADPGREMREQQESIQKMLDRADSGRASVEEDHILRTLGQADPTRTLRGQQEALLKTLDRSFSEIVNSGVEASRLLLQYENKLLLPQELTKFGAPLLDMETQLLNLTPGSIGGPRNPFADSAGQISRQIALQVDQFSTALSSSIAALSESFGNSLNSLSECQNESMAAAARAVASALSNFELGGFAGLADFMSEKPTWLDDIRAASSPVLDMFAYEMAACFSAGLSPAMVEGFGAEFMEHLGLVAESESEGLSEEALQNFVVWLFHQFSRLPNTKLTRQSMLSIFLTFISILYTMYSGQGSEKRILAKIEEARAAIEQPLDRLDSSREPIVPVDESGQDSGKESDFHIAITNLRLRSGPGTDFEVMRVLPPNLTVRVEARDGGWALVEFFDVVEGKLVKGWVAEAYLMEWAN